MKKILLISFEYPLGKKYCGGVGQIVKSSNELLASLGHEVYVLITDRFNKKHPVKLLLPDHSLKEYPSLNFFQKKHPWRDFDYIIQHFVNWANEFRKIKKLSGRGPKIFYHFHSILRREKESGFDTQNNFLRNQEKMIEISDRVICPSRYEYENFMRYFPYFSDKVVLMENTIEPISANRSLISQIKDFHNIKKNEIVSMYVGRLERIKGAHILLKQLPSILTKYKSHKIFIIGKSLERKIYRQLIALKKIFPQRLIYIRYLRKDLLYQYYYLSHIYINTSLSESFSLSTHEGAFCSNALLLNRLPVFDKFQNAALFFSNCNEDNGDSFIEQYKKLAESQHLRSRLSKKAVDIAGGCISQSRLRESFSKIL